MKHGDVPPSSGCRPVGLTATIGISAEKGGEAEIELIYALPDVSWQASYDICVNMQSKDAPFTIRYKAAISQFSGEAQVKNVSEYALVAGPANVYIDGSFVAKSRIPVVNPQETFECPLGKKASCSGLINKTTTTVYYRQATIRNTKPVAIQNLKILDRVPVSENAQIVVKLLSPALSPPPPPAPVSTKVEKSPSSGSSSGGGILDKAKGYQFKGLKSFGTLSSSSSSLKVSEDVFAQWEGEEEGEEGTGEMDDWRVCTIPSQGKVSVGLRWEESRPVGMKSVEGAR
ncbi:mucoidy inhibitor [Salix suchowensis]|nr:mucoidy inhibitor [Salix suchowensis]